MKCKGCGYELWRLHPPGPCPECGVRFDPTEFKFRPRAVRFLCPHCDEAYQGLDADGLPSPREFRCVSCGGEVRVRDMPVDVLERLRSGGVMASEPPWPRRGEIGFLSALFSTIGRSLFNPTSAVRGMSRTGGMVDAAWFCVVVAAIVSTFGLGLFGLFGLGFGLSVGRGTMGMSLLWALGGIALMGLAGALVHTLVVVPLWAAVTHVVLAITGSREAGYGATLRCLWYAQGASVVAAVPLCGMYLWPVATIWSSVSATLMLREAQGVSGWRATAACVAPPVVLMAALVGLIAWGYAAAVSTMGVGNAQLMGPSQLAGALITAQGADGQAPRHVVDLGAGGQVSSWMLNGLATAGAPASLPGGGALGDIDSMTDEERAALAAALTDNAELYVFGGFVFTHRGVDLRSADGALWLAFTDPRTMQGPIGGGWVSLMVHQADGQEAMIMGRWPEIVADQNALRAAAGLGPIPVVMRQLPAPPGAAAAP